MRWLLLLLLIVPAVEIGVFIWIGGIVGPWWVILLIFLSGVVGVWFARQEGMGIWIRANESMQQGKIPTEQMIDGLCVLIGAVFLFAPGFVTDFVGLLLIIPMTRHPLRRLVIQWFRWKINRGEIIYRR